MLNINSIIITGRLVNDIEVKSSSDGSRHFAKYTLANTWYNSRKVAEDGTVSYEPHTDFYDCVETIGNLDSYQKKLETLKKGHEMHVIGKLTKKTVKKEDGSNVSYYNVRVTKTMLNYACFEGRVVADGQKYQSKDGDRGLCKFRLASTGVNYKDKDGNWVQKTAFIECRMNVFNYEKFTVPAKGDAVLVEGYFVTDEYTTKEGENRTVLTFCVEPETYAISRKEKPVEEVPAQTPAEAPAPAQTSAQAQIANDFADEDIPF